jgi:hypothetical protein
MSMHTHRLITYLQPGEAYTLIEFLDQVREVLMATYGDAIRVMLQEASALPSRQIDLFGDDGPF